MSTARWRDLLTAAGQHDPHGVDEGHAGPIDHVGRRVLELEAGDEVGEQPAELLGAGLAGCPNCCAQARSGKLARAQGPTRQRRGMIGVERL